MSRSDLTLGFAAAAALLAPAAAVTGQSTPETVTFCAGEASLPMSAKLGPTSGYDVEIAQALAEALGAEARFLWLEPGHDDFERAVREGRCDTALGVIAEPGPMVDAPALDGLALTRPYYRTGYFLIRRPDAPPIRALDQAGDTRIAVEGESVVTFTLRQRGRRVHVFFDHEGVIRAVAEGRATYGYLWGPVVAWSLRGREDVIVAPEFDSPDRWPFALAVRAGDADLLRRLDAAILELERDGTIGRILERYGLPPPAPR